MRRFGWGGIAATIVTVVAGCGGSTEPPKTVAAPGGLIAYTAGDGIHLVTADGQDDRKVSGTGALSGPKWAPDGDRFAAVDLRDC